jgi:hypothetical protein
MRKLKMRKLKMGEEHNSQDRVSDIIVLTSLKEGYVNENSASHPALIFDFVSLSSKKLLVKDVIMSVTA